MSAFVKAGDLNGDGWVDFVATWSTKNYGVVTTVLGLNQKVSSAADISACITWETLTTTSGRFLPGNFIEDMDGDGDLDIINFKR